MSLIENLVEQHSLKYLVFQLLTVFIKQYAPLLDKIAQQRGKPIESYVKKNNKTNLERLANLQSGTVYILMDAKQKE